MTEYVYFGPGFYTLPVIKQEHIYGGPAGTKSNGGPYNLCQFSDS